jgi:SAM-dependent methyltransferase
VGVVRVGGDPVAGWGETRVPRMQTDDLPPPVAHLCPACHQPVDGFRPGGVRRRPAARCPSCSALERHRFLAVLLDGLGPVLTGSATVVDIAPSRYTTAHLDHLDVDRYVRVDLDPDADGRAVDVQASLTALPFAPASVDLLLCYHVLEHVPDDRAAMREIARVLRPGGHALVQVPFRPATLTDEDPDAAEDERVQRFGQADHVRWYGADLEDRLAEAGLTGWRIEPGDVLGDALVPATGVKREPVWVLRPARDGERAVVARRPAPRNGLLAGLFDLAGAVAAERDAALAEVVADRDRVKEERDRMRAERDRWRERHERITGNPVVRAAASLARRVRGR